MSFFKEFFEKETNLPAAISAQLVLFILYKCLVKENIYYFVRKVYLHLQE